MKYKYYVLFAMLYVSISLSAMVLDYKLAIIWGVVVTAPVFIMPIYYSLQDIIAEVYGYQLSRQLIWFKTICTFVFSVAVTFLSKLPSPSFWDHQQSFDFVFGPILRAFLGGTAGVVIGAFFNVYILAKLKLLTNGRFFYLRSFGSTILGELVQISFFVSILYIDKLDFNHIVNLIFMLWPAQVGLAFIIIWPATLVVKWLKKAEKTDVYDYNTDFNPFKISIDNKEA